MKGEAAGGLSCWTRRWRRRTRLADAALALAAALAGFALLRSVGGHPIAASSAGVVAGVVVAWQRLRRWGRQRDSDLARHLDRRLPELEESTALLLESERELPLLARLQRRRAAGALEAASGLSLLPRAPLVRALVLLSAAAAAMLWVVASGPAPPRSSGGGVPGRAATELQVGEGAVAALGLAALEITVRPPAYTGLPTSVSGDLEVAAAEGSELSWRLRTTGPADEAELILDDRERLPLEARGEGWFEGALTLRRTRLYWLRLAGGGAEPFRSPYARLRALPDRAPEVELLRPHERVVQVFSGGPPFDVHVRATDDHGIDGLELVATLATGSGELVRFRGRRLPLQRLAESDPHLLESTTALDLAALGMEPGTELYLFAEAADSRRPEANRGRSATRILRMPGDRTASIDLGAGLPVLRLPEFFRSQRQIILDTERLVSERPRLTAAELRRRSEGLGFDQRALRMRYAGLLGEEFEAGQPVTAGGEEAGGEELEGWGEGSEAGSVAAALEELPAGFSHEHDAAEINTFFDEQVKAQLKAALGEMWSAEGRLRSGDPETALPFEYRALTALKSAQEAERVHVGKTGFQPPPLDPERRLTGDLEEVANRRLQRRWSPHETPLELRRALEVAQRLALDPTAVPTDFPELAAAVARSLTGGGEVVESGDLELLTLLREWAARPPVRVSAAQAARLEAALWAAMPAPDGPPGRPMVPSEPLWESYRRRLEGGS